MNLLLNFYWRGKIIVKFGFMPIFFQQDIDGDTKLAIWKIEEEEKFFLRKVPLQREITHPHKRLQHLAGRYLLKLLFPDFPTELIRIADTRKPFLEDEAYHFSISHCGDYAAVIVSRKERVGLDIEIVSDKPARIQHKFLSEAERLIVNREWSIVNAKPTNDRISSQDCENTTPNHKPPAVAEGLPQARQTPNHLLTLLWSAKEAMFKWWGKGKVDFSEMLHVSVDAEPELMHGKFIREELQVSFPVHYKVFPDIVLAWVHTEVAGH
jgi:phosphopantetheinyl transferase